MGRRKVALSMACGEVGVALEEREGGRFCQRCKKMQYDFRGATRREVLAVLDAQGGRACGRVRLGPGGEPRFKPEPPSLAGAARGAVLALALAACDSPAEDLAEHPVVVSDDGIVDHSSDRSRDLVDHQHHAHHHDPVVVDTDDGPTEFMGEIAAPDDDFDPIAPPSSAPPSSAPPSTLAPPSSGATHE